MAFSLCGRCGIASNASRFERARRRGIEKAAPKEKAQREEVPLPCDRAVRSAQVEGSSPGASSFPLAEARRTIVHDAAQDPRRAERRVRSEGLLRPPPHLLLRRRQLGPSLCR